MTKATRAQSANRTLSAILGGVVVVLALAFVLVASPARNVDATSQHSPLSSTGARISSSPDVTLAVGPTVTMPTTTIARPTGRRPAATIEAVRTNGAGDELVILVTGSGATDPTDRRTERFYAEAGTASPTSVTVTVYGYRWPCVYGRELACNLDAGPVLVGLELESPLGARVVIDGATNFSYRPFPGSTSSPRLGSTIDGESATTTTDLDSGCASTDSATPA